MRFEAYARSYDQHARPQHFFAERVAEFARVPAGAQVLELGAGTGALTAALCSIPGTRINATDVSPAMVELGRKRAPEASWDLLDAFRDRLPEADVQASSGLLQWAQDPHSVLKAWRDGLRPGGRMVHGFPCDPCLSEWRQVMPESPLAWRTAQEWLGAFEGAGLHVLRHERWVMQVVFRTALEFLRSLHKSGVTGAAQVSGGRLRRALRDYEARHHQNGGVPATWAWMAVEAVKAD